jgi:hypothetical protein
MQSSIATSSQPYYGPAPTINGYTQQNLRAAPSTFLASGSGDAYYGLPASSGPNYDASYYSPQYDGYTPLEDWFCGNEDPRALMGMGAAYDVPSDLPLDPSQRNADLYQFYEPGPGYPQ